MQFRTLTFGRADPAGRTVPVTISTEEPVDRGDFIEVLDHRPGSIDLSRSPLPLIESHDNSRLNIGIVEDLRVVGGRLKGVARFGSSARAMEIFQDVLDRVVRSVSVGYQLTDEGEPMGDGRTIRFRWAPYEVSCVACPADTNAGFFRYHKEPDMEQTTEHTTTTRSQRIAAKNAGEGTADRAQEIIAMGRAFADFEGARDMAEQAVISGEPLEHFRERLMTHMSARSSKWQPQIGLTPKEVKQYSLCRAITAQLTGDWRQAGLERAAHEALAQGQHHRAITGILVPAAELAQKMRRDLVTTTTTAGGYLVGTDHRADLFVDALREQSAVLSLGAQRITGLVGNVDIPVLAGDVTPVWMATETTDITESQPTFGQLLLSPKSCAAYTELSRRLLNQSGPAAETLVMHSMTQSIAYAIDKAAIQGTGANGQPTGLLLKAGIGAVTGANIDWPAILDFESDTASSYVDLSGRSCGFVTTPLVRKLLKGRVKVAGYPEYLWQSPENRMNGYAAMATSACPAGYLIFGDWSEVLVSEWGPVEIVVNPYSQFQKALVGIRAIADIDIGIKHAGAFSAADSVT